MAGNTKPSFSEFVYGCELKDAFKRLFQAEPHAVFVFPEIGLIIICLIVNEHNFCDRIKGLSVIAFQSV